MEWEKLRNEASLIDPSRIIPVQSGVYRITGEVGFQAEGTLDSRIGEPGSASTIPVTSIDDFMKDKEAPTFIKMDIEGSEEDALMGARRAIQNHAPKLAISVYHKATDLWKLPLLIKRLHSGYRLYLRHYTNEIIDTVCYAL